MPDLKISQLTDGGALQAAELVPVARGGVNRRISGANVLGTFTQDFVNGDLLAGVLTATHALNQRPVVVQVFDNSWQLVNPDLIELNGVNSCLITLSSLQPLTGTYHLIVKK